jgi:hypothetical protein
MLAGESPVLAPWKSAPGLPLWGQCRGRKPLGTSLQNIKGKGNVKIAEKALIPLFLVTAMLVSCNGFKSTPATSPTAMTEIAISIVRTVVTETLTAIPTATFTATPLPLPSPLSPTGMSLPTSDKVVYYYFVDIAKDIPPEGSVVIMPDAYILAPTLSGKIYNPDTAANLRMALEDVLNDGRNGWISSNLEIVNVTFDNGHADVVLQGEYFGVGDVTLVAASMQILMTVFAYSSVQTATVTLNGDTIGNLGVSHSMNAKPVDYVFTRTEIEAFMNEHPYMSP